MTRHGWLGALGLLLVVAGLLSVGHGLWIEAKAVLAQVLLDRAWTQARANGAAVKPWPWADTWPVARIEAPRIGARAVVLSGVGGEALAFGPGHMAGTPPPGGPGTSIIAGHRDTHFRFLQELRVGDELIVEIAGGRTVRFVVVETGVVDARASGLDPDGPPRLALVTCWPFDAVAPGGAERYVVLAEPRPTVGLDPAPSPV